MNGSSQFKTVSQSEWIRDEGFIMKDSRKANFKKQQIEWILCEHRFVDINSKLGFEIAEIS